jgi:hypothetical protein
MKRVLHVTEVGKAVCCPAAPFRYTACSVPVFTLTVEYSLAHKFNDEYLMVCGKLELKNCVALSEAYLRLPASDPPPPP